LYFKGKISRVALHHSVHYLVMKRAPKKSTSIVNATFAGRLKEVRESFGNKIGNPGLKQKEFAEILGLEAERYSTYERGTREPPLSVLAAIRRITGVKLDLLIGAALDLVDSNLVSITEAGAVWSSERKILVVGRWETIKGVAELPTSVNFKRSEILERGHTATHEMFAVFCQLAIAGFPPAELHQQFLNIDAYRVHMRPHVGGFLSQDYEEWLRSQA